MYIPFVDLVGPVLLVGIRDLARSLGLVVSAGRIPFVDMVGSVIHLFESVMLMVYMCLVGLFGFDVSAEFSPLVDLVGSVMMIVSMPLVGPLVLVVSAKYIPPVGLVESVTLMVSKCWPACLVWFPRLCTSRS